MVLDAIDCRSVHVPKGCANAYLTLEQGTIIHYYMSERYVPGAARGFRYDDPAFGVSWPMPPELVSAKDLAYEPFDVNCL
jgi:dTDP-4-dehydrorhamnose 3,5-epimerase